MGLLNSTFDFDFASKISIVMNLKNDLDAVLSFSSTSITSILCFNSLSLISKLNDTVNDLQLLISTLQSINLTKFDIIESAKNLVLMNITEILINFKNMSISMNNLIFLLRNNTRDQTSLIITLQSVLDVLNLKVSSNSTEAINSDLANRAIPSVFNSTYKTFKMIDQLWVSTGSSFQSVATQCNQISDTLKTINDRNLFLKYTASCFNNTIINFFNDLTTIQCTYRAYDQLLLYINFIQNILYNTFNFNRYQLFLARNYNLTINPSITITQTFLDRLFFVFNILIEPILSIESFNVTSNVPILTTMLKNSSTIIDAGIHLLSNLQNLITNLTSNPFNSTIDNINVLILLLNFTKQYNTWTLNNNFTRINECYRGLIETPSVFTNKSVELTCVAMTEDQCFSLKYNSLIPCSTSFYNSLLNYKMNGSQAAFISLNSSLRNLLTQMNNELNSTMYTSFSLEYVKSTVSNISSTDYVLITRASIFLRNESIFFSRLISKFLNFSLLMNDINYINDTILLISEFQIFINDFKSAINNSKISILYSCVSSILSFDNNLYNSLSSIQNALSVINNSTTITRTTITTSNTALSAYWSEWLAWSFCKLHRQRSNSNVSGSIEFQTVEVDCSFVCKFNFRVTYILSAMIHIYLFKLHLQKLKLFNIKLKHKN